MSILNVMVKGKVAFNKLLLGFSMALMFGMAVLLLVQIFCRFALNSPFFWVEEILRMAQVWITFLVCPLVLDRAEHPGFKLIPELLPIAWRKAVWVLSMTLVVLVGYWIAYYGYLLCMTSTFVSANGLPRYWFVIPCVIGGTYTVAIAALKVFEIIRLTPEEVEKWKV